MDRRLLTLALGTGLAWSAFASVVGAESAEATAADGVIVSVNGKELTEGEVERILAKRMEVLSGRVPEDQVGRYEEMFREQLAEEFVVKTLLSTEAADQGFTPTDEEVEAFIQETKEKLPPGLDFEKFLSIQGMDADNMQAEFKTQLAIKRMLEAKSNEAGDVTEEDLREFYDQEKDRLSAPETVRARHILLKVEPDADAEAKAATRKELEAIRDQLVEGAEFAALAQAHSDCPSASQGGDLGEFGRGQMVKPFEEAAFSQEVGAVGEIVETRFGYHVIEVMEHTDAEERSFEDVRDQIARHLEGSQRGEIMKTFVDDLRAKATIEYPSK